MAFLFRENRRGGRTDGRMQHLMRSLGGPHNNSTDWPLITKCMGQTFVLMYLALSCQQSRVNSIVIAVDAEKSTHQTNNLAVTAQRSPSSESTK